VIHEDSPDKFTMVEAVKTEFGAKTMALDPKTHNLLVATAGFNAPPSGSPPNVRPTTKAERSVCWCTGAEPRYLRSHRRSGISART